MKANTILLVALAVVGASCTSTHPVPAEPILERGLVGAYGYERAPSDEECALFDALRGDERLAKLQPVTVSTQVVAGINLAFRCKDQAGRTVRVVVFRPLPGRGDPRVTTVETP